MNDTTQNPIDIHKAGAILIKDRRLLLERSQGKALEGGIKTRSIFANEIIPRLKVRDLID